MSLADVMLGYRLDFFAATGILSLMFFAAGMYLKHVIVRPYRKDRQGEV